MSIRRVTCPGCGAAANVPATITNVKCPGCATVWNVNQPAAAKPAAAPQAETDTADDEAATGIDSNNMAVIAGVVGTGMFIFAMLGLLLLVLSLRPKSAPVVAEPTIKSAVPEPYRVVALPDEQRRRIYDDYRKVARTTVEKPLPVPQGTRVRQDLEVMLDKTYERELNRFAALHDITVDDVREIIKEGDAKKWDPSVRSKAMREGKRVYPKEMSEGWDPKNN